MTIRSTLLLLLALCLAPSASAADKDSLVAPKLGDSVTTKWRFGVIVKAPSGAVTGIVATTPVPTDWPEQSAKIVEEESSPLVKKVSYRMLDGGVKQMVISIPRLAAGEEASATVVFEVTKSEILPPDEVGGLVIPAKLPRELAKFILPSPYIESTDPKIKSLAPGIIKDQTADWEKTEAIFDYVRDNVKYEFAKEIKPAIAALKDGKGDCEELSSLFIAFCRANKIPARAVWVPDHCYPEFYLQDAQGRGQWFPCQAAGAGHDFGTMKEARPILQKGDNFRVPEEKQPQRYVKQFLKAANAEANPEVTFILERVKD